MGKLKKLVAGTLASVLLATNIAFKKPEPKHPESTEKEKPYLVLEKTSIDDEKSYTLEDLASVDKKLKEIEKSGEDPNKYRLYICVDTHYTLPVPKRKKDLFSAVESSQKRAQVAGEETLARIVYKMTKEKEGSYSRGSDNPFKWLEKGFYSQSEIREFTRDFLDTEPTEENFKGFIRISKLRCSTEKQGKELHSTCQVCATPEDLLDSYKVTYIRNKK